MMKKIIFVAAIGLFVGSMYARTPRVMVNNLSEIPIEVHLGGRNDPSDKITIEPSGSEYIDINPRNPSKTVLAGHGYWATYRLSPKDITLDIRNEARNVLDNQDLHIDVTIKENFENFLSATIGVPTSREFEKPGYKVKAAGTGAYALPAGVTLKEIKEDPFSFFPRLKSAGRKYWRPPLLYWLFWPWPTQYEARLIFGSPAGHAPKQQFIDYQYNSLWDKIINTPGLDDETQRILRFILFKSKKRIYQQYGWKMTQEEVPQPQFEPRDTGGAAGSGGGGSGAGGGTWGAGSHVDLIRSAYEILGLEGGAPLEEVKKSYKVLALKWHPDKWPRDKYSAFDIETATEKFKVIQGAYQILSEHLAEKGD